MTGVPSFERKCAIEEILKAKELDYCLYSCSSRSSLRTILFDVCKCLMVQVAIHCDL